LVEGEKNVLELLSSDFEIRLIIGTSAFLDRHQQALKKQEIREVTETTLSSVSTLKNNETVLAVAQMRSFDPPDCKINTVALDGVRDPGNMGTIIRTLDWFGIHQLVCTPDCVEFYNPKVINSTMGSFGRVHVCYDLLPEFMEKFQGTKVGAEMQGKKLETYAFDQPTLLVLGSESHGIRPKVKSLLDHSVTVSRHGQSESLNVGVATGIICHKWING